MVSRSMRSFVTSSRTVDMDQWSVVASPSGPSALVFLSLSQILPDKTLKWMKFVHFTHKWKCRSPRELFVCLFFNWAFALILFRWLKFNLLKLFLSTIHSNLLKGKICLSRENWTWVYRWYTLSLAYSPSKKVNFVLHAVPIQSEFMVQITFQGASIKNCNGKGVSGKMAAAIGDIQDAIELLS